MAAGQAAGQAGQAGSWARRQAGTLNRQAESGQAGEQAALAMMLNTVPSPTPNLHRASGNMRFIQYTM